MKLALAVGHYPALSGQRLRAELDLLAAEPRGMARARVAARWRALRLWDSKYAASPRSVDRVRDAVRLLRLGRASGDRARCDRSAVTLIALFTDQRASGGDALPRASRDMAASPRDWSRRRRRPAPLARRLDGTRWRARSEIAEALGFAPHPGAGRGMASRRPAGAATHRVVSPPRSVRATAPVRRRRRCARRAARAPPWGNAWRALRRLRLDRLREDADATSARSSRRGCPSVTATMGRRGRRRRAT